MPGGRVNVRVAVVPARAKSPGVYDEKNSWI